MSEFTGKNVNYYLVDIKHPKRLKPYEAECEDIIEALGMTFAEGCAFKAIWRSCAARTLGKHKQGQDSVGVYDAEKVVYYGERMVAQRKRIAQKVNVNIHIDVPKTSKEWRQTIGRGLRKHIEEAFERVAMDIATAAGAKTTDINTVVKGLQSAGIPESEWETPLQRSPVNLECTWNGFVPKEDAKVLEFGTEMVMPRRPFMCASEGTLCPCVFGSKDCGYIATHAIETCNKTFQDCVRLHNSHHFRGTVVPVQPEADGGYWPSMQAQTKKGDDDECGK